MYLDWLTEQQMMEEELAHRFFEIIQKIADGEIGYVVNNLNSGKKVAYKVTAKVIPYEYIFKEDKP